MLSARERRNEQFIAIVSEKDGCMVNRLGWMRMVDERWICRRYNFGEVSDEWTLRRAHDYRDIARHFKIYRCVKNCGQVRKNWDVWKGRHARSYFLAGLLNDSMKPIMDSKI